MRLFYQAFPKCDALRHELSWTHYRLLTRLEKADARQWYMNEAAEQNWSSRALERQIGTLYYERLLLSQDKAAVARDHSVVRYSVLHDSEQLFASRYKLVLPSEEELRAELTRESEMIRQALTMQEQDGRHE